MPSWEDFADFKVWERKKPVETFKNVEHNFLGDKHSGVFVLNNWHVRFIEYKKKFLRGIVEDDFTGALIKPPLSLDEIIDRQVSRTDHTVFYLVPDQKISRNYSNNLVNVDHRITPTGGAMRFKLTSEDELSRLSGSVSQNKSVYEEWKEKTKIKDFKCDHCGSPYYSITGPGFIACDSCGKDYDVRK